MKGTISLDGGEAVVTDKEVSIPKYFGFDEYSPPEKNDTLIAVSMTSSHRLFAVTKMNSIYTFQTSIPEAFEKKFITKLVNIVYKMVQAKSNHTYYFELCGSSNFTAKYLFRKNLLNEKFDAVYKSPVVTQTRRYIKAIDVDDFQKKNYDESFFILNKDKVSVLHGAEIIRQIEEEGMVDSSIIKKALLEKSEMPMLTEQGYKQVQSALGQVNSVALRTVDFYLNFIFHADLDETQKRHLMEGFEYPELLKQFDEAMSKEVFRRVLFNYIP